MSQTLFIRRYPDGLAVTAIWASSPEHRGFRFVGDLELIAARGSERIACERYALSEDSIAQREQRTTSLTNHFVARARASEPVCH
ncbi:MAG: hypothetical protein Q8Q73_15510 [Stagnimonas sp.]|nr:hypothetical protein [Stagnimonas sp.]